MNIPVICEVATGENRDVFGQKTLNLVETALCTLSRLHNTVMEAIYPNDRKPQAIEIAARRIGMPLEQTKVLHDAAIREVRLVLT